MAGDVLYYKASGKFPGSSVPIVFLGTLVVAAVLGFVYGILVNVSPIIYVNLLGTLGVGAAVGYVAYYLGRMTHNRNPAAVLLVVLISVVVADYFAFVGWVYSLGEYQSQNIYLNPTELAGVVGNIAEVGVWSIGKSSTDPVSGAMLYAVWIIEFLILAGAGLFIAYTYYDGLTYCEKSGSWVTDTKTLGPFEAVSNPDAVRAELESGDFSVLSTLRPHSGEAITDKKKAVVAYAEIELAHSEHLFLMTLRNITVTTNAKNETSTARKYIARRMLIDRESYELIEQIAAGSLDTPAAPDTLEAPEAPDAASRPAE